MSRKYIRPHVEKRGRLEQVAASDQLELLSDNVDTDDQSDSGATAGT